MQDMKSSQHDPRKVRKKTLSTWKAALVLWGVDHDGSKLPCTVGINQNTVNKF